MSGTLFWDVDTQYDFMRADGKLYGPHAVRIIPILRQPGGAHRVRGDRHAIDGPAEALPFTSPILAERTR